MSDDRLVCSVVGQQSFVLVPAERWESFAQNEANIDYSKVDYTAHPWLMNLTYLHALDVHPGDCLYVPKEW